MIIAVSDDFDGDGGLMLLTGIAVIVLGTLISWLANILLAGYGVLIESVCKTEINIKRLTEKYAENGYVYESDDSENLPNDSKSENEFDDIIGDEFFKGVDCA